MVSVFHNHIPRNRLAGGECRGLDLRSKGSFTTVGYNKTYKYNRPRCEPNEQNTIVTRLSLLHAGRSPGWQWAQVPSQGG